MIEIADMKHRLADVRAAGEDLLRAQDNQINVEREWAILTADRTLSGESGNNAIFAVLGTERGKELADLIRVRTRDILAARIRYNIEMFEFEMAHIRVRQRLIEEETKLKSPQLAGPRFDSGASYR